MVLNDRKIIQLVQDGNIDAFGDLVRKYEKRMLRYARRFIRHEADVEDMVQEIFIRAFKNIQDFDRNRPFLPWLYRIAHNQLVNFLRRHKRLTRRTVDWDTFFPYLVSSEDPQADFFKKELEHKMAKCLNKLPFKYQAPLVLYYLEEMSYEKISQILKIPISTVGVRILRGKKKLKAICHDYR